MKRLSVLLTLVLAFAGLRAQTAQSVLDKTIAKLESDFGIETKVQIKNETQFDILPANSPGTMKMNGSMYQLALPEMRVWFDGETQWALTGDEDFQEIYISTPSSSEIAQLNPFQMLRDRSSFKASQVKAVTVDGKNAQALTLTATGAASMGFSQVIVTVDALYRPLSIDVEFTNTPGHLRVIISDYKTGIELKPENFRCPVANYKEADIIDLR